MQLQNIDHHDLQKILIQLDHALHHHQQWYNDLTRSLCCRLPPDAHNTTPDSFKYCRFGQWYYSNLSSSLSSHPGFIAIGESHKQMHELASHLLTKLNSTNEIIPFDYDNFANSLERLRLEIYTLKNEIETLLYNRDPLTMTTNRISMLPILREQQELTRQTHQPFCIVMIDIDFFKKINDQYGHIAGDKVLVILAHYLISHLRPFDRIFRYGGEEFLLCLQHITLTSAIEMVDRLRDEISKMPFNIDEQNPIHVTVSCGVTLLNSDYTVEEIIDHADKALYLAKSSGRNNTRAWNINMTQGTSS